MCIYLLNFHCWRSVGTLYVSCSWMRSTYCSFQMLWIYIPKCLICYLLICLNTAKRNGSCKWPDTKIKWSFIHTVPTKEWYWSPESEFLKMLNTSFRRLNCKITNENTNTHTHTEKLPVIKLPLTWVQMLAGVWNKCCIYVCQDFSAPNCEQIKASTGKWSPPDW